MYELTIRKKITRTRKMRGLLGMCGKTTLQLGKYNAKKNLYYCKTIIFRFLILILFIKLLH
jgi:hypothetical protein